MHIINNCDEGKLGAISGGAINGAIVLVGLWCLKLFSIRHWLDWSDPHILLYIQLFVSGAVLIIGTIITLFIIVIAFWTLGSLLRTIGTFFQALCPPMDWSSIKKDKK